MARMKLFVVALLSTSFVVGVPVMLPAQAKQPATVLRDVSVEPGAIRASAYEGAWFQRTAIELPINANLVAASFRSAAGAKQLEELVLEARFRTPEGWSAWERLTIEPDEAPDAPGTPDQALAPGGDTVTFGGKG